MVKAIFAGSFDPFTIGHLRLVSRIIEHLCDELIIGVGTNLAKKTLFSEEERVDMVKDEVEKLQYHRHQNVVVKAFSGLLIDFARANETTLLIRGVRACADFEYETNLANINRHLAPEIETILLTAQPELVMVSSSAVKEIAKFGGSIEMMVSETVARRVKEKFVFNAP